MQRSVSILASAFVMAILVAQSVGGPRVLHGGGSTGPDPRDPTSGNGPALTGTVIELKLAPGTPQSTPPSNGPELTGTSVE